MSEQGEITPDPEEDEGEGSSGDASPDKEREAYRTGMHAEREKRQASEQREAELRGRLSALEESASRGDSRETTFTRAQLDAAAADGRITEAEAERIYESQMERRISERVTAAVEESTAANGVVSEIQSYKTAIPGLAVRGSDEFAKVASEFEWMRRNGQPDNVSTELAAMRSVFGPPDKLKVDKGKPVLQTHEEGDSGSGGGNETPANKDGWPKDMKADTRRYYEGQINQGIIPDIAAAKTEWSYKPKHRPSHAA